MSKSKYDTEYTPDPICPHCGAKQRDAWEMFDEWDDHVEVDCWNCEKSIYIERQVSVEYSTYPVKKKKK